MLNRTLYIREMKNSLKLLVIFAAIMTMYVAIIITMYDPALMATLDSFVEVIPELMASVGMQAGATSLLGFMVSYLYGFILLVFPMVFCILRANGLIAKYVERGSMVTLMAAPVRRETIAATQMWVLISGIVILLGYITGVEVAVCHTSFPGELDVSQLVKLNAGLLCLHLFIGGICFWSSCLFSETRYSLAFGAGIPALMYVIQMLANVGGKARDLRYVTFFTLFQPEDLLAGESSAYAGAAILLLAGCAMFAAGIVTLSRKDLHI